MVIISTVVMAVTWSIGRCQEEPCWVWGILSEIDSAAAPPLRPSLPVAPPKVRAVASTAAAERKRSRTELEQVEETPQGPAFKATWLSSTRLPAVACPVHLLHAWSDMPCVRSRIGAEMWAYILKWWFPPTSSPLTWCNYPGALLFQTFDSSEVCKGFSQTCFVLGMKYIWEDG